MKTTKSLLGMSGLFIGVITLFLIGCEKEVVQVTEELSKPKDRQLVFVGDTPQQVHEMLGAPSIEFPDGNTIKRWYAGYEVTISNNVVVAVLKKAVESEEEREEKAFRAKLAETRLRHTYQSLADKENISYAAWLGREKERKRLEREERAKVEAYKRRVSEEKQTRIYADALKKSCGCLYGHHCRH